MIPKESFILSLDQGTTSSRALLFDKNGNAISSAQKEFKQIFPEPGWVEHDPLEIWFTQLAVVQELIEKMGMIPGQIMGIGITNQRETTVIWDRKSGKPIYPAIVWQDRRTAEYCDKLRKEGWEETVRAKTGLLLDAYFSATKIKWILDHVDGMKHKAHNGDLCFGTIDTWLVWNLSGKKHHVTDLSNASRTLLFNIHTLKWDTELLKLFDIPEALLPELKSSSEIYGYTDHPGLPKGVPISGIAGDQQAALFGQLCFEKGSAKNTYGTGCFMMMNTGENPVLSDHHLISTLAWQIKGKTTYALEGSIFVAGASIGWIRDGLGFFAQSRDSEALATSVENNGGVYFVPALTGLGAPHWDADARGLIIGLTRGTTKAHITRAALESIAFQVYDVLGAMEKDIQKKITYLKVDGGAVSNHFLMQFQADLLDIPVIIPLVQESTALGAAFLAGLGVGFWEDLSELKKLEKADKIFKPGILSGEARSLLPLWERAIHRSLNWLDNNS